LKLQELSQSDLDILKSTENIVDGIAAMYGQYTEVVLHSLDTNHPSIIKIANGHVTERSIGAPITNLALFKLKEGQDISDSYVTKTAAGKTLRSITIVIRNSSNIPIGLLCINTDMDAPLQSALRAMLPESMIKNETSTSPEIFARNIDETLQSSLDTISNEVKMNPDIPPSKKNREIVTQLYELGVFELKDSTQIAAKRLGISVHSIYRYQREIRGK
jgi:predicted transcriptional regulator YheO